MEDIKNDKSRPVVDWLKGLVFLILLCIAVPLVFWLGRILVAALVVAFYAAVIFLIAAVLWKVFSPAWDQAKNS